MGGVENGREGLLVTKPAAETRSCGSLVEALIKIASTRLCLALPSPLIPRGEDGNVAAMDDVMPQVKKPTGCERLVEPTDVAPGGDVAQRTTVIVVSRASITVDLHNGQGPTPVLDRPCSYRRLAWEGTAPRSLDTFRL